MNGATSLAAEWERIDLLGACLSVSRRGADIPQEIGSRLENIQQTVCSIRQQEPWCSVVSEYGFEPIDQDILACSLAPEAEPRLGWMYQELQAGISSPYPTPALIRELFAMDGEASQFFTRRFSQDAPLLKSGMIETDASGLFQPILPSARACKGLLGWSQIESIDIPGAVSVPVTADWDDLVLPRHCIKSLHEFILWVSHRRQVEDEWGGRISGGPVALFSGVSGTGKSYAAEVVANALGWPLYRVDLGLLVSKYIGETEKNLNTLFDAAHNRPMVLLFDEADSLFSKRGQVKEARDRYANMEVSHLLSRIERHRGPCILTSNLRQQIDAAFTRRFQIVIDFPRPDATARENLWRRHIPHAAPLEADVNCALLGSEFNLTGGQIRNAALHAAFLAAGASSAIGLTHIASAVWTEFAKKSGERSSASLGKLAVHLPREVTDDSD
ncbi:MAG: ATP-binding protein [Gammaproteobacteria bacterium]|nr:ATP-binding protein [Gammaproteobacteria bacterium]